MKSLLCVVALAAALAVTGGAATAQPARPTPQPARDARCDAARDRYDGVTSDKAHRTVEEQSWVEYDEGKKYLRLCAHVDDGFTRSMKRLVAGYEAAGRCDAEWPRLSESFTREPPGTPGRSARAYEAAKEFLRLCEKYFTSRTRGVASWVEEYEKASRGFDADETLAELVPAARGAARGSVAPETYARIAEAYVVAVYYPAELRFRARITEPGPDYSERREAEAQLYAAEDLVIDAYARAVASCGSRAAACGAPRASWRKALTSYYAWRHGGAMGGLHRTIARALDAPMPKL